MTKAVIFDLDGTLIDSEPRWFETHRRILLGYGCEYDLPMHQACMGRPGKDIVARWREKYQLQVSAEELQKQRTHIFKEVFLEQGMTAKPGVVALVRALREAGMPLGLASSSGSEYIDWMLKTIGLDGAFGNPVGGDEIEHGKPAPDIFQAAARQLGIEPIDCFAVEDSPVGTESAHRAGMRILGILDKRFVDSLPLADKVVETFEDVNVEDLMHI